MRRSYIASVGKALLCCAAPFVQAQFPLTPEGVTVVESRFGDGVKMSYKETTSICETTKGVKSYAGYVHLPPGTLSDLGEEQAYPINTFFWFFESRKDPENAPLSIWMNGGPGSSSLLGLLVENGPCFVNPDSNSTRINEWSWNNEVNMLYLDQPVQVGLSYDTLVNVTVNTLTGKQQTLNATDPVPEQNSTFLVGTWPSGDGNATAHGTRNAAIALWHFSQEWFQQFPGYRPKDSRISIATESYGGRYGPAFTAFFEEQNERIANGSWTSDDGDAFPLDLDTLLIVNGCIDRQIQWPSYPHMAFNNTYGIEAVNETIYEQMLDALHRPGGCADQIDDCRAQSRAHDPDNRGRNASVNAVCQAAETFCTDYVRTPYLLYSGRNYYDVATRDPDPYPDPFYEGWLNQPHVQAALGVPLNWTQSSGTVAGAFRAIGDYPRPGWVEDLAYVLGRGVKVALVYGDRDYACNWLGGEAVSLAVEHAGADGFRAAGYADIRTNASHVGGLVRQHGNLSFSRVFGAGHEVPSYQPETAYRIFTRALFDRDIATGDEAAYGPGGVAYSSDGPADAWGAKNVDPDDPVHFCYVLDPETTCSEEQIYALGNGTACVRNWIVVDANSTALFPDIIPKDACGGGAGGDDDGKEGGGDGDGGGDGSDDGAASTISTPSATGAAASSVPTSAGVPARESPAGNWLLSLVLAFGVSAAPDIIL